MKSRGFRIPVQIEECISFSALSEKGQNFFARYAYLKHWWSLFIIHMFEYCRKSNKRKKKEVPYSSQYHEELDGEEPVVYEEVGTLNIYCIAPQELVKLFFFGCRYDTGSRVPNRIWIQFR